MRRGIFALTAATLIGASSAAAATSVTAKIKRLPSDPPRIALTKPVYVDLPAQTPDSLVKALFARRSPFLGKVSGFRKAFMPDLARAMALDVEPAETRIITFDWRYGAPRKRARRLKLSTQTNGDMAVVTAHFKVAGKPSSVRFELFERRSGWRIHDVSQTAPRAWSLRACLRLRGTLTAKACDRPARDPDAMKPDPPPKPLADPRP
jgi:hypothetical protein